ncbi:type VI secretion system contractile sheath small subunit, partial [Xanthomonas perforans]
MPAFDFIPPTATHTMHIRCKGYAFATRPLQPQRPATTQIIGGRMSVRSSSQKFIARNRAPRVQIEYDVEIYGSQKKVQVPFVMGV